LTWKSPNNIKTILSLPTNRVAYNSLCNDWKVHEGFVKNTRALPDFSVYKVKQIEYFNRKIT